jgi:hypothetical protein
MKKELIASGKWFSQAKDKNMKWLRGYSKILTEVVS